MRNAVAVGALVAAASMSAPAAATPSSPAPTVGHDYRIGDAQPIDSVNPFKLENQIAFDVASLGFDLLLNYRTADGQPDLQNSLATNYTSSPDAKTWTFTLRSGVTWSDGVPFTSADVKWTYDAVRVNTTNVLNAYLANVAKVDAPDASTVVLHLGSPDVRIPSVFVPILPQHVFAKYPVAKLDKIELPLPSVTTAPYQITEWNKDGTTILRANPRFRGGQPAASRVLITHYSNEDGLLRDIKLGNLDMIADGDNRWSTQVANEPNIKQWNGASPGFDEIAFNSCPPAGAGGCSGLGSHVHAKVVQDHAIREALAYGIDRTNISKTIYAGQNRPAYGLLSPYYSTYFKDWSTDPQIGYRFDQAKARQVLADGGWDCSSHPCVKDGTKAQFTLYARTNDTPGQNAMRRVVAWAGEIGIKIDLEIVTEDALNNKIYAPGKNNLYAPDFDAFYWAWTGDPTPDFNVSVLQTGSSWSDSYYSDKQYDDVTTKALQTTDHATRVDLLHQAEKIAMTDLPYIPIVYANAFDLTRTDTWHNYQPAPSGSAGSPIGANWSQLTLLQPGPDQAAAASSHSASPSGVPIPLAVLLVAAVAGASYAFGRRHGRRNLVLDWTDE